MPQTKVTLCDGAITVDYDVIDGDAILDSAYIDGGELYIEDMMIRDEKNQMVNLRAYLQRKLDRAVEHNPELLTEE